MAQPAALPAAIARAGFCGRRSQSGYEWRCARTCPEARNAATASPALSRNLTRGTGSPVTGAAARPAVPAQTAVTRAWCLVVRGTSDGRRDSTTPTDRANSRALPIESLSTGVPGHRDIATTVPAGLPDRGQHATLVV